MRGIGKCIYVRKLTRSLEDGAGVFGSLALGYELLLFNAENVHGAYDTDDQEGQLIRNVCRVLIEGFEHAAVCKCAERIQQAVDNGKRYCKPAFCIVMIACILTCAAQLLILVCFRKAEGDNADADKRDSRKSHRWQAVYALSCEYEHSHYRAGRVAYRRGYRKLDISKPDIADRHRNDIQRRNRQVLQNNLAVYRNAADKYLIRGMNAHYKADGHDHLQVTVFIIRILTADL